MLDRFLPRYRLLLLAFSACALGQSGCRQQVYHELYAEQTAHEIRALQDRIYEYDAEYRALEQELWATQDQNERLMQQLSGAKLKPSDKSKSGVVEEPITAEPNWEIPDGSTSPSAPSKEPETIDLGPGPAKGGKDRSLLKGNPKPDLQPPPSVKKNQLLVPPGENSAPSTPPGALNRPESNKESAPADDNSDETTNRADEPTADPGQDNQKDTNQNDANQNNPNPLNNRPAFPGLPDLNPSKPAENLPPPADRDRSRDGAFHNRALGDGRIVIPNLEENFVQLASAEVNVTPHIVDTRMVEIAFHPTLCRGNNTDGEPGDDGLYLVLQPQNSKKEFLAIPAELTIVAYDPNRPEEESRIARWAFTAEDLQPLMQAKGSAQGFHLSLPWQAEKPMGDRVQVFARYLLPDGRQLRNQREINLHQKGAHRSMWTPRVSSRPTP